MAICGCCAASRLPHRLPAPGDTYTDFRGVATFFVISGFIMCYISRADPEMFFRRRLQRIVPHYWLCTVVTLMGALHPVARSDDARRRPDAAGRGDRVARRP